MTIELAPSDVLAGIRATLGLSSLDENIGDTLLTALLRRSAGIHCPCSPATLRASIQECLHGLCDPPIEADRIDDIIGQLIVGGDLLELHDVTTTDEGVKGTWLFAAPPSFVVRPDDTIYLFGTVPDQDSFLPAELSSRTVADGFTRTLRPLPGEDLRNTLLRWGLQEVPESIWLKLPRKSQADDLLATAKNQLEAQPRSGDVPNMEVIDATTPVTYYRGRWKKLTPQLDGTFVGRRPQEFGSPIWCLATVQHGTVIRFLDLPPKNYRWRGADYAWHLQMDIDQQRGSPQLYRRVEQGGRMRLDFFSPIPQWAERRLMIFGHAEPRDRCLFSYSLPQSQAAEEENFLHERLWLRPRSDPT